VLAASGALAASAILAGCGQEAAASASIQLGTAYLTTPSTQGNTAAYVVIQNNGAADRLTAAKTSAGGVVTFYGPTGARHVMRALRDIVIPANSTLRLTPGGPHLLISHARRMRSGTQITLTLTFAHAGTLSVPALVTNPFTGGSSYFLN
jgi:copper(I)-binding protein